MINTRIILGFLTIATIAFTYGCKKEEGPGGNSHINGHVEIEALDIHVPDAVVEIWYGATSESGASNDISTTNSEGEFEFEELLKGDYYLSCSFIDSSGTTLTGGQAVIIDKKSDEFEADILLK
jgi:hypothetical protein